MNDPHKSPTATELKCEPRTKGKDLVGRRFTRLVVLAFFEHRRLPSGKCYRTWKCVCDCGNTHIANQVDLEHGRTVSCGCRKQETLLLRTTHGMASKKAQHALYATHEGIMARCNNPRYVSYKDYGGRGIRVCERWHNFANFVADMYPSFIADGRPGISVDRKDVNGDYCPENCRWATPREQSNNRRNCRYIVIDGVKKTFTEWCRHYNTPPRRARSRLDLGWDAKDAFSTPLVRNQYGRRKFTSALDSSPA